MNSKFKNIFITQNCSLLKTLDTERIKTCSCAAAGPACPFRRSVVLAGATNLHKHRRRSEMVKMKM